MEVVRYDQVGTGLVEVSGKQKVRVRNGYRIRAVAPVRK
jgi:hypothetical protein